jgi:DNA-binding NtrC family response regulator
MIGEGPAMHELKTYLARVAATDATVLITGETGTGKKLVANYIHRYSHRHQKPLVDINCAAIPDSLYVNAPAWRISFSDLPELFRARCQETAALPSDERIQLLAALSASNWNKNQAAQKLHWSRVTLYRKMWRYGIVSKGDTKKDRAKS